MRSAARSRALTVATLIVATACFLAMSSSLLIAQNLKRVLTLWGEDIQMTVYVSPDLDLPQKQKLEEFLHAQKGVRESRPVTQAEALQDFRAQLSTYAPDLAQDDELVKLIPASYQISLDPALSSDEQVDLLKQLAVSLKQMPGVDEVSYGQEWVEKYATFVRIVELTIQIFGAVLIAASVLVMSNVIRALVQNRREEIEVLELIGATAGMIRRPFLMQGFRLGLVAAGLALLLSFGAFKAVQSVFLTHLSFLRLGDQLQFFHPVVWIFFLFAGGGLGVLGSYLSVRKINDGWAASRRA